VHPLSEIIHSETAKREILTFARFMELALYCPVHGYYETKKDNLGRRGDFYTNVSVGPLFGQLLAFQFAEWLQAEVQSPKSKLQIVEAGAHNGQLAEDVLTWLGSHRPALFEQSEYWIIEPSARRQEWQREKLEEFLPHVRWFSDFQELVGRDPAEPAQPSTRNSQLHGVIFANELLDALPVHRYGWDAKSRKWFEWGVALDGGKLVWAKIQNPDPPPSIFHLLARRSEAETAPSSPEFWAALPDGSTIEFSPAAPNWWREAAGVLEHGRLMTIDYGLTAEELFSPGRTRGTLRAYYRHHASNDLLANVGKQDLTAHVNFSAIQAAGESAGLTTESFSTQAQFLTQIAGRIWKNPEAFGGWDAGCTRQFQTLTHPDHLGRAFRVLVQAR
jgi:SAM-dependent MidA family methyltransferase